jgi:hypothetical protein
MTNEVIDLSGVDMSETFEPTVQPDGTEAELRIVSFLKDSDKNGHDYIMPFFEVAEDPYSVEFGDYIRLPDGDMSPKEKNKAILRMQQFGEAFGIDFSQQLDIKADIVGQTGWAILGIGKDQDGNPTNKIRKYVQGA